MFVGRELPRAELSAALDRARAGTGSLVLVAGEAGIGKTALVERLADTAAERGVDVFWGGCWEGDGQAPYWPFVQVMRRCLASYGRQRLIDAVGTDAEVLGALLPEECASPISYLRAEQARFRLFDGFTRLLADIAGDRPLLVVIDDLHWSDEGSLRLLGFLGHQLRDAAILVVGTYRDVDAEPKAPLHVHLPALTRLGQRVALTGLSVTEVGELMRAVSGTAPAADLVAQVHRRSGGNPLFAGEVARSMISDDLHAVPAGVAHVVDGRLALLPQDVVDLVRTAAVLGNGFDVRELSAMAGRTVLETRSALEEPERRRVLVAQPDGHRFDFLHALVRDALYRQLSTIDRAMLHERAAEVLAAERFGGPGEAASRIAHHFALGSTPHRAVDYAVRAGGHAVASFAYEDAVGHFAKALDLVGEQDQARRCGMLIQLADAQWRAGEESVAAETYQDALTQAWAAGDAEAIGKAALGCCVRSQLWTYEPQLVRQLSDALGQLSEEDSVLRARLLGRLAVELYLDSAAAERRAELAEQAVAMARRLDNPAVLAETLSARHHALWTAGNLTDRLATATEVLELAERAGDDELALDGQLWRLTAMLELGDRTGAGQALGAYGLLATRLNRPLWMFYHRSRASLLARIDGRFDDAETLAREAESYGHEAELPVAGAITVEYYARIAIDRGDLAAATEAVEVFAAGCVARPPFPAAPHCYSAELQATIGATAPARAILDRVLAEGAAAVATQPAGVSGLVALSYVADLLGAREYAEPLSAALRPYAHQVAVASGAVSSPGPVAFALGVLAALAGSDDASAYFESTMDTASRLGARPWLARARVRYARMLLDRDRADGRGLELARAGRDEAVELGMRLLVTEADALLGRAGVARVDSAATLGREGDYWTLAQGGSVLRLKHTKGMGYLAELLARPGTEVHAMHLAGAGPADPGDAGAGLDATAKEAYRGRLADLRDDLAEAEAFNDPGRADRAKAEIDALTAELARAVGLGGRDRPTASNAERARLNVTRGLRAAIARIGQANAELGHHLDTTVHTGTFCGYDPGPKPPFAWRFTP